MRRLSPLLVAAVLAAACSSPPTVRAERADSPPTEPPPTESTPTDPTPSQPTPAAPTPIQPSPAPPEEPADRIVVLHDDGRLTTMLPDGTDERPLTEEGATVQASEPVWSPDAGRLAWVEVDADGAAALVSARFDQSGRVEYRLDSPAAYLSWDISSTRVASLSPAGTELVLAVTDIAREQPPLALDQGSPYFFSWGPDGDEVFVHASGFRADRVSITGTTVIIDDDAGPFQAPVWLDADRALVYATSGEQPERAELVSAGAEGQGRLPIATYDGYLTFVVHPDQVRIAVQVTDPPAEASDVITTSAGPSSPSSAVPAVVGAQPVEPDSDEPVEPVDPVDPVDELPSDLLQILAVYGGDPVLVDLEPALAFFWSPDGGHLAYLVQVAAEPEPWFEWRFYDGVNRFAGPDFRPSPVMATDHLVHFDQYARSHSFFSPDGSAFVYAGVSREGDDGIWVQPILDGATAERISDGVLAVWSPGPAGSQGTTAP